MDNLFPVIISGFAFLGLMLYGVMGAVGRLRNDVGEAIKHLKSIDENLAYRGTIHGQLLDIEKAISQRREGC